MKFGCYFAADAWLWLWNSILVKIPKLGLVKILKLILKLVLGQDSEDVWSRFVSEPMIWAKEITLVSTTQPSGPLCLWQWLLLLSLLLMMRYFLILCLSQFSSWQFRAQFRSVGGWYKFCERLGARSGRGRSKLFFGWFVARCTFPAIWRFEVEKVQIWGLGDSGINI